jgi:hypothetical protein
MPSGRSASGVSGADGASTAGGLDHHQPCCDHMPGSEQRHTARCIWHRILREMPERTEAEVTFAGTCTSARRRCVGHPARPACRRVTRRDTKGPGRLVRGVGGVERRAPCCCPCLQCATSPLAELSIERIRVSVRLSISKRSRRPRLSSCAGHSGNRVRE